MRESLFSFSKITGKSSSLGIAGSFFESANQKELSL